MNPVIEALDAYFSDTTQPPEATRNGLQEVIEHARMLLQTIEADLDE